ncbi:MAG: rhomboid family intramembrane serine protease [Candidatus Bathyarchaeia archaeon]
MLPLKDLNKPLKTPHVNRLILTANIIIFAVYWLSKNNIYFNPKIAETIEGNEVVPGKFVMVPIDIINGQRLYTLFTSMFMHADWLHLFGNMLFLFIFGDNVEDVFGHVGYLIFYLICGVAAAFAHIISIIYLPIFIDGTGTSDLATGVVGASGAISGVLGAYFVLYPKSRILTLVSYFILPIPAFIFLGYWFIMQWIFGMFDIGGGIAYWAHIGGFLTGMFLALIFGLEMKKALERHFRL